MKIALKITPQRNTQYANMAEILAAPELLASPLNTMIIAITSVTLAGQSYLIATLRGDFPGEGDASVPTPPITTPAPTGQGLDEGASHAANSSILKTIMPTLSRLGATSEVYQYFAALGEVQKEH